MKLTKPQQRILAFIRDAGAVTIDQHGRLVRNDGEKTGSMGASTAARLVAFGMVSGGPSLGSGLLVLTEYGIRQASQQWPCSAK